MPSRSQVKTGAKLSGEGLAIIAVIIGIVASVWPDLFRPHPVVLWTLGGIGVCLFLTGNILENTKGGEGLASRGSKFNVVGRDNSGKQISANVVQYFEAPGAVPSSQVTEEKVLQDQRGPIVSIGPIERKHLCLGRLNVFTFDSSKRSEPSAAVLWIMNERGGRRASGLGVSLTFRNGTSTVAHVNRAFWIGKSGNVKSLDVGTREAVVLGIHSKGLWCVYENSRKEDRPPARTASRLRRQIESALPVNPQRLPFDYPIEVEVAVISSSTDETLALRRYVISPSVEGAFSSEEL